ncbi:MAG: hypothetical protein PVI90_07095 [Desulfobacteraceae bacterium]|jgi:hypothetical protein
MFKKNEANQSVHFSMRDLGGQLPESSLSSLTVMVRKDTGNFASAANTPSEDSTIYGHFSYIFSQAETNADVLTLLVQKAGYADVEITIYPESKMVDDLNDLSSSDIATLLTTLNDISVSDVSTLLDGLNDISVSDVSTLVSTLLDGLNDISVSDVSTLLDGLNDISVSEILAMTGITQGGTLTFAKAMNILLAYAAGLARDKSGESGTVIERLDPEDGSTVIITETLQEETPYRDVGINI